MDGTTIRTTEERIAVLLDQLEDPALTAGDIERIEQKIAVLKSVDN